MNKIIIQYENYLLFLRYIFCITHQYLNLGIGTEYRHSVDTTTGTINLFVRGPVQHRYGTIMRPNSTLANSN